MRRSPLANRWADGASRVMGGEKGREVPSREWCRAFQQRDGKSPSLRARKEGAWMVFGSDRPLWLTAAVPRKRNSDRLSLP